MKRTRLETPRLLDACTIGAATGSVTRDGDPLVFSNSDDPFTTRTKLVVVQPAEGYKFIATEIVSPPPPVPFNQMHTRGVNEAGLAYTWAYVMPSTEPNDGVAIGIPPHQFGRLVLSQAATVGEAISLVEKFPRAYHGNFLFGDASGEIALVEISTQSFNIETRTGDGYITRSNHWVSAEMSPIGADFFTESSTARLRRSDEIMKTMIGSVDVHSLAAITSDHEGREQGLSICSHGAPFWSTPWAGGTVSSEVIEPRRRRLWYCYGWPCGSEAEAPEAQVYQDRSWGAYLPFELDSLEPGELVTIDGRLTAAAVKHLARSHSPERELTPVG
jgi:hypothetical protein